MVQDLSFPSNEALSKASLQKGMSSETMSTAQSVFHFIHARCCFLSCLIWPTLAAMTFPPTFFVSCECSKNSLPLAGRTCLGWPFLRSDLKISSDLGVDEAVNLHRISQSLALRHVTHTQYRRRFSLLARTSRSFPCHGIFPPQAL